MLRGLLFLQMIRLITSLPACWLIIGDYTGRHRQEDLPWGRWGFLIDFPGHFSGHFPLFIFNLIEDDYRLIQRVAWWAAAEADELPPASLPNPVSCFQWGKLLRGFSCQFSFLHQTTDTCIMFQEQTIIKPSFPLKPFPLSLILLSIFLPSIIHFSWEGSGILIILILYFIAFHHGNHFLFQTVIYHFHLSFSRLPFSFHPGMDWGMAMDIDFDTE